MMRWLLIVVSLVTGLASAGHPLEPVTVEQDAVFDVESGRIDLSDFADQTGMSVEDAFNFINEVMSGATSRHDAMERLESHVVGVGGRPGSIEGLERGQTTSLPRLLWDALPTLGNIRCSYHLDAPHQSGHNRANFGALGEFRKCHGGTPETTYVRVKVYVASGTSGSYSLFTQDDDSEWQGLARAFAYDNCGYASLSFPGRAKSNGYFSMRSGGTLYWTYSNKYMPYTGDPCPN